MDRCLHGFDKITSKFGIRLNYPYFLRHISKNRGWNHLRKDCTSQEDFHLVLSTLFKPRIYFKFPCSNQTISQMCRIPWRISEVSRFNKVCSYKKKCVQLFVPLSYFDQSSNPLLWFEKLLLINQCLPKKTVKKTFLAGESILKVSVNQFANFKQCPRMINHKQFTCIP